MNGDEHQDAVLTAWLGDLARRPHGLRDFGALGLEAAIRRKLVGDGDGKAAAVELLAIATAALLAAAEVMDVTLEPEIVRLLYRVLDRGP